MKAPSWVYATGRTLNQNSPAILSAASIAGVGITAYLAARASVKAASELDKTEHLEKETRREKAEVVWRFYIPPVLSGAATIACIVGAHQIGARRQAAYLGAYTLADAAFREYKDEVLQQLGKTREAKIDDALDEKAIRNNPVKDEQVIIAQGGDSLCFDRMTGRYFRSDIETIRKAANDCNARIFSDMYVSLNDFYELLGLGQTDVGEYLGFNIENPIDLRFSSHLADNGLPCLAVGFTRDPRPDYTKF